jgi:hypothetical protein
MVDEFTVTVGGVLTVTTADAGVLRHTNESVVPTTREYVPAVVVLKEATLPGFVAPDGTVH